MAEFTWVATDARTGKVIADLTDLEVGSVKRSICRYEATTATLPLPTAPENWQRATLEGGTNLILLSDGLPVWGGMITKAPRTSGDDIKMSVATLESYLDRRYVGDVSYAQVGQNIIVADLINRFVKTGPLGGIPFRVEYSGAGRLRDRTYEDKSDKTIYSILQELSSVDGGPEWTVEWEHLRNPERFTPVFRVGDRIGVPTRVGMAPAATFDMPGCVVDVEIDGDYSAGSGANSVIASSSATGDTRPQSPAQVGPDDGRPTFEFRFQPSTSITAIGTLTSHAASALASMVNGAKPVSLSAVAGNAPQLGTDWMLGDDIGYKIGGLIPDRRKQQVFDLFGDVFTDKFGLTGNVIVNPGGIESVPGFPGGVKGVARCFGWELTFGGTPIVTPILIASN